MERVIENIIERYVRCPDTLDDEMCREAERLLRDSAFARAIGSLYRDFYVELDALEVHTSPLIERFVKTLYPPEEPGR